MTRVQLHDFNVEQVRQVLTASGFHVERGGRRGGPAEAAGRFDLIVDNLTVAVRVAKRSTFPWSVLVRGKRYRYRYCGHRWNLHAHGSTRLRPDVWVFVATSGPADAAASSSLSDFAVPSDQRERSIERTLAAGPRYFVVMGRRVRGFYTLTLREPSKSWLVECEGRWETIRELTLARHRHAA